MKYIALLFFVLSCQPKDEQNIKVPTLNKDNSVSQIEVIDDKNSQDPIFGNKEEDCELKKDDPIQLKQVEKPEDIKLQGNEDEGCSVK